MRPTQAQKVKAFRRLHDACFVIPNPWDAGSARVLAALGYEALATTSVGFIFSRGRRNEPESFALDEVLAHCGEIVAATPLPVSADLENGYAETPEGVAETIRRAAATGLAGGSIEDFSGDAAAPIYELSQAVERVAAAVEAARGLADGFVLTARAENFLHGRSDLDDTIRRLQAYEQAGAEVLYAPGLPDLEAVRSVCAAVARPVNVIVSAALARHGVEGLAAAGARRISFGSGLARAAMGAALRGARETRERGSFAWLEGAPGIGELNRCMAGPGAS